MRPALQELLPPRWKQLVRRDERGLMDLRGAVWGAPYRWGCTLIAYNKDKLERCFTKLLGFPSTSVRLT